MKAPKTIPRSGTPDASLNYQELLRQGLSYCQELGGDLWTDYNVHDPGVTILEQLCYALSDLSYRTETFSIPEILATPRGVQQPNQPLYTGDQILTCNPLTSNDYRKLLYDRIQGLKNAWLVPITDHPLGIEGLYKILVETREEIEKPSDIEAICQKVRQLMRTVRNLGEDVDEVRMLEPQRIRVEGTIEIGPKVNPAKVLADVLFNIQNSLIPFPQVQLVDQLLSEMPPDQIWNGPLLYHGALEQQSLRERKSSIQVQEIANIILQVQGVKRVKHLRAGTPPGALSEDSIALLDDHVPRLDPPILKPQPSYSISIELEGGFKCSVDSQGVWTRIQELEANMRKNIAYAARSLNTLNYLQVPSGDYREIEEYFSIQHQFPAVYGLSKYGITNGVGEGALVPQQSRNLREARKRQLKAYLLFFEQPMADYLSQLSHVAHLFSLDDDMRQTYFYQPLAHDPPRPSAPQKIAEVLQQRQKGPRKNPAHYMVCVVDQGGKIVFATRRLPDQSEAHEMRRQMIESSQHIHNYRVTTNASGEVQLVLHSTTGDFLALGQERFTSIESARSGAERCTKFMVRLQSNKQLLEKAIKVFRRKDLVLQIIDAQSRIVLTGHSFDSQEERNRRIAEILANGIDRRNYHFLPTSRGGFNIHLHNSAGELLAEGEEIFETEFDAEEGLDTLMRLLRRMAQQPAIRDQHLHHLPEVEEIGRHSLRSYQEGLAHLAHHTDRNYLRRRNRILDHLLARFGEHFDNTILERLDLRPYGEKDDFYNELIRWKTEFLRSYVQPETNQNGLQEKTQKTQATALGAGRALGFDYGADDDAAVSGLERRASLLLGMHGHFGHNRYHMERQQQAQPPSYDCLDKHVRPLEPEWLDDADVRLQVTREHIVGPRAEGEPDLNDLHHNFVFRSEDSSMFRQLLSSGACRENYRIEATGGEYHILFQPSHTDRITAIHHAHSLGEAESAIAGLVRYFQGIRQSAEQSYAGERMHVVEHVLLRPLDVSQTCCVHISKHDSQVHLNSIPVASHKKKEHLDLILILGQEAENYRVQAHSCGKFHLVLYERLRPIAMGALMFENERDAHAAIHELTELVRSLHRQPKVHKRLLQSGVADDFYSHRVSVFLPNWPIRFQNNEFKLYAEQLLYENAPAHLAIECFWLSFHDMREFERLHQEWKIQKRAVQLQLEGPMQQCTSEQGLALNEASRLLKEMIETLQRKQDDAKPPHESGPKAGQA